MSLAITSTPLVRSNNQQRSETFEAIDAPAYAENIIMASSKVDEEVEEQRAMSDAASVALKEAKNKRIQEQCNQIMQLHETLIAAESDIAKLALANSQAILSKDELIQRLMANVAEQEIRLENARQECIRLQEEREQVRQADEQAQQARLAAEEAKRRAHEEALAWINAHGF